MPMVECFGIEQVRREAGSVVTVGSFDGLHRGHRIILAALQEEAKARAGSTTVVTFEPHPQLVLKKSGQPPLQILTSVEEKVALLRELDIARVVVIPFTLEFSQTPSATFVRDILYHKVGMQAIVIGHDHGFGKNREGDVATLSALGRELGFAVRELPPYQTGNTVVSSTHIRQALQRGEIAQANEWLASNYQLSCKVVTGDGRGKRIGFATANLEPDNPDKLIPANGVYAVIAKLSGETFGGMMNIGVRPTFAGAARTLEVHLLNFDREIYGQRLVLHFIARLRDEKKFDGIPALVAQLHADRAACLRILPAGLARP